MMSLSSRLPLLLLLCLALQRGPAGSAQAAAAGAAGAAQDPDASHPALARCAVLEADEASDDEEAEACLATAGADAALPCAVRALALVELSHSLTSKKKLPVLRQALAVCPSHPAGRVALARALAKRRETRAEVIPLLEAGLRLMETKAHLATMYHNVGLAHRIVGNWEAGVNALRVAMDFAPTDAALRADMLAVLTAWQGVAVNQTDLFAAPIFSKPFNAKGLRPVRLPAETEAEKAAAGGKGKGRVVRAYRQHAYPRIVTVDKLIAPDEAAALHATALELLDGDGIGGAAAANQPAVAAAAAASASGDPSASKPPPIWCFSSPEVLVATLARHKLAPDLLGPIDVLAGLPGHMLADQPKANASDAPAPPPHTPFTEESNYRCLSLAASATLSAANAVPYSRTHNVYRGESALLDRIEERIEGGLGLAAAHGAKWQITSYDHGESYAAHTDCVVGGETGTNSAFDRIATVLVYLSDVEKGGETSFTKLKPPVAVSPKAGRLLVWRNMNADGVCDRLTEHQAQPVTKGRKIIAQRWYYREAKSLMNFRPGSPPLSYYSPGAPLLACDAVDSCRQYNDWTVNWANWKGFDSKPGGAGGGSK